MKWRILSSETFTQENYNRKRDFLKFVHVKTCTVKI